jgi:hypothetical protein
MSEESFENPTEREEHENVQPNPTEHEEVVEQPQQVSTWKRWFGWTSQDYWVGVAVGSVAVVIGLSVRSFIRNRY